MREAAPRPENGPIFKRLKIGWVGKARLLLKVGLTAILHTSLAMASWPEGLFCLGAPPQTTRSRRPSEPFRHCQAHIDAPGGYLAAAVEVSISECRPRPSRPTRASPPNLAALSREEEGKQALGFYRHTWRR